MKTALATKYIDYNDKKPTSWKVTSFWNSAADAYRAYSGPGSMIIVCHDSTAIGDLVNSNGQKWTGSWDTNTIRK